MLLQMVRLHSFSWLSNIALYYYLLYPFSIIEHLGCFKISAIVNNAMNVGMHIPFNFILNNLICMFTDCF